MTWPLTGQCVTYSEIEKIQNGPPVFCFTTDIEWAPEWAISELLDFFSSASVPLSPFLTHRSAYISQFFSTEALSSKVGVHPNFLPNSSHGTSIGEVVEYVRALWPAARSFRCHHFFESTTTTLALKNGGYQFDSNLGLFLQPHAGPLMHNSGLTRFPVFWEDDVHAYHSLEFELAHFSAHFDSPGMKVINLHPLFFALNLPSLALYEQTKALNRQTDGREAIKSAFQGAGTRTFTEALVEHIHRRGYAVFYLQDLYLKLKGMS